MSAGTWESHHAITTLMFRYAEYVDAADFDGIAALFADGRITNEGVDGAIVGPDAVRKLYARHQPGARRRHDCAPATSTANVIVDIDEVGRHGDGPLRRSSCSSRRRRCRCSRS